MKRKNRQKKPKARVHMVAETPGMAEKAALPSLASVAPAREKTWSQLHPSHPNAHFKLTDEVERLICQYISDGLTFSDAARLAGIHRGTSAKWRNAGIDYLNDPEAHPEDQRFGQYAVAIEEAELTAKRALIKRIVADPDWRSLAFILKARYKTEFAELAHVQSEVSGPGGEPIQVHQTNPFVVHLTLGGPEVRPEDFRVIDHTHEHRESATLPDPYAYIKPKQEQPKKRR